MRNLLMLYSKVTDQPRLLLFTATSKSSRLEQLMQLVANLGRTGFLLMIIILSRLGRDSLSLVKFNLVKDASMFLHAKKQHLIYSIFFLLSAQILFVAILLFKDLRILLRMYRVSLVMKE